MISKLLGRHVAPVGGKLGRRQGLVVATGFVLGCVIWLSSWYFDYREGRFSGIAKDVEAFQLTGVWLRESIALEQQMVLLVRD